MVLKTYFMNYQIKAFKILSSNGNTVLESYEKDFPTYVDAENEYKCLQASGKYTNINIYKKINTGSHEVYVKI